jgi:hypothetical protein
MRKRYDLRRSDNYMVTGRVSYVASGSGSLTVVTGFPVMRATVSFATIPLPTTAGGMSSSSESSGEEYPNLPRVYVSGYTDTGFTVAFEGIPEDIGYIEFDYSAV